MQDQVGRSHILSLRRPRLGRFLLENPVIRDLVGCCKLRRENFSEGDC